MKKLFYTLAIAIITLMGVSCDRTSEIKVMSYNIRLITNADGDNHWDKRKHASINMINEERPTVFGLQEAVKAQVDYLQENLPEYAYYGIGRDDGKEKGEFMAIFYLKDEVEMLDHGTFWISETPDTPSKGWDSACYRTCTWAVFKVKNSGKKFVHLNTHLDHRGWTARKEGVKMVVAKAEELAGDKLPVFATADWNASLKYDMFEPILEAMYDARAMAPDTDDRSTINNWQHGREYQENLYIDHIFFRNAEAMTFKVLRDKGYGAEFISDHYPVVMTAKF